MRPIDLQEDAVLAALRELRTYDVPSGRAERLRTRCHRALITQDSPGRVPRSRNADVWRRTLRVLAGAWCVLYLFETIRRAAAVYGF